jgi:hypothetical protein
MKIFTSLSLGLCVALGLVACGSSFKQPTPDGFVKLVHQHSYDYRAVTADGLVYSVKEISDAAKGDTAFWAKAVENKMRIQAGYALIKKQQVTTTSGLEGTQIQFGFDRGKTPHLYYVTLFTKGDSIFVIESGGTKELMESHSSQLETALQSFRIL